MRFIRVFNYDGITEYVNVNEIESIREPGGRVHDHGCVILKGGRHISLGQSMGQAERLIKELAEDPEINS